MRREQNTRISKPDFHHRTILVELRRGNENDLWEFHVDVVMSGCPDSSLKHPYCSQD